MHGRNNLIGRSTQPLDGPIRPVREPERMRRGRLYEERLAKVRGVIGDGGHDFSRAERERLTSTVTATPMRSTERANNGGQAAHEPSAQKWLQDGKNGPDEHAEQWRNGQGEPPGTDSSSVAPRARYTPLDNHVGFCSQRSFSRIT